MPLLAMGAARCSQPPKPGSTAAPPLVVCGQALWTGAAGATLTDAASGSVTIRNASAGGNVFLKISDSCIRGANVVVAPAAAKVVGQARTKDNRIAAVVFHSQIRSFDVQVSEGGGANRLIRIRL